jgi:hypothetical protein
MKKKLKDEYTTLKTFEVYRGNYESGDNSRRLSEAYPKKYTSHVSHVVHLSSKLTKNSEG